MRLHWYYSGFPYTRTLHHFAHYTIGTSSTRVIIEKPTDSISSITQLTTVPSFFYVAQCCQHLSYLEVMHGPDFDKDTVEQLCSNGGLSSLTTLILNFTAASRAALEDLLGVC